MQITINANTRRNGRLTAKETIRRMYERHLEGKTQDLSLANLIRRTGYTDRDIRRVMRQLNDETVIKNQLVGRTYRFGHTR